MLAVGTAHATLTDDLQTLVTRGNAIDANLSAFSFENGGTCSGLGTLNTSIEDYTASVAALTAQITSALSLTETDMTSLEDLSALGRSLAAAGVRLGTELQTIDGAADLVEYRSGLEAMLRLAEDIGTMADRILEMANRILTMADNIGTMADRIVYTVALQSANMAYIDGTILTTQANMVQLNASLSSIVYNLTLGQLVSQGSGLDTEMNGTVLSETNMADELVRLEAQTAAMEAVVVNLYVFVNTQSGEASYYINGDTLTYLTDLSAINTSLAKSIERFSNSINQLAPMTETPILSDATAAMLQLAHDVAVMGDRIIEMSKKIVVMADNIGIMADRIVEVQGIMNDDMGLTSTTLGASQKTVIALMGAYGL